MKIHNSRDRLLELMLRFNLNQSELARKCGLDKSVISYYVNGKREPMQDNIYAISSAFNIDPAWLMGYDVPMMRTEPDAVDTDMIADFTLDKDKYELIQSISRLSPENFDQVKKFVSALLMCQKS